MRKTATLLAATALIALAGCAKHRPPVLPPAPVDNGPVGGPPPPMQNGPVRDDVLPGSNADFMRSVQSNTVNFGTDQYDIDPAARAILDGQAAWLQRNPQVRITVEGHCDERGTREYNLALGDRRANAAKNYLADKGIDAGRITTISYGKERPLAVGSDEEAWAQNRRAVTVVVGQ